MIIPSVTSVMKAAFPNAVVPEVSYNFLVLMGLLPFGDFKSVEEVSYSIEPYTYNEGGRNSGAVLRSFKEPGKRGRMKLKWGTVLWSSLYDWMDDVKVGHSFRREMFIVQLNRSGGAPTRIMQFHNCFPVSWSGAPLDTGSSEWSMEELEVEYDHFNQILTRLDLLGV